MFMMKNHSCCYINEVFVSYFLCIEFYEVHINNIVQF